VGTVPAVTALGGVVLSELCGAEVASDRTDVTTVPSVHAGSVRRAYSCQSGHIWLGLTSPRSSQGRDGGERVHLSSTVRVRQEKGVVAVPGLSIQLGSLGLARLDLGRSGFHQLMCRGPLGLLTNQCLETPRVITSTRLK
jgi:hypothetical protein